jgi:phenylacetate-CoA ligase
MFNLFNIQLKNFLQSFYYRRDGLNDVKKYEIEFNIFYNQQQEYFQKVTLTQINKLLHHAITTTHYFSNLFKSGIIPSNIQSTEDLKLFPVTTKNLIEEHRLDMLSSIFPAEQLDSFHTGGTSGTPTSMTRNKTCTSFRIGRQNAILNILGYPQTAKCGLLWGAHQDIQKQSNTLKSILRAYASSKLTLDCTFISEHSLNEYYYKLIKYNPSVLYGYPNALFEFARFITKYNLKPIIVKQIFCTAERLTFKQRHFLTKTFGGDVYNLYCTREHGLIGFECELHNGFHLDTGSVYVEVVNTNEHIDSSEEIGDLLITDLANYAMPMIRYKIGDRGFLSNDLCQCGCQLPLLKYLHGRVSDTLFRKDGVKVSGVMLVDLIMDNPDIKHIQIIQNSINEFHVKIVTTTPANTSIFDFVKERLVIYFSKEINVNIEPVNEIPVNHFSGKAKEIICNIKN